MKDFENEEATLKYNDYKPKFFIISKKIFNLPYKLVCILKSIYLFFAISNFIFNGL